MEEAKVEMNDSPADPQETLTVTPAPITAKDVWSALECVQKKYRSYLVPALRKLQRVPPTVFEAIAQGAEVDLADYNLTDADQRFVLAILTYIER